MLVKLYNALKNELENDLTWYTESDILTQKLVFLPVEWDENDLLYTKQLHMMI